MLFARRCDLHVRSIDYFDREVKRIRQEYKKTPVVAGVCVGLVAVSDCKFFVKEFYKLFALSFFNDIHQDCSRNPLFSAEHLMP